MILIKNSYYSNESKILIFVNFSLCVVYFVNNIALRYLLRKNNQVIISSFPKRSWLFWDIMYFYKKNKITIKIKAKQDMKRFFMLVALVMSVLSLWAQETVKFTGSLALMSQTNSLFTGGRFSPNPAISVSLRASYKSLGLTIYRNSDLLDGKSEANVLAIAPSYQKQLGVYTITFTAELEFQDVAKESNLLAPYIVISREGTLNLDLMGGYFRTFQHGSNAWIGRLGIGKSFSNDYSFKLYAWTMNSQRMSYSLAGELSKKLGLKTKVSLFYHLNNFTSEKPLTFGTIRLEYSF